MANIETADVRPSQVADQLGAAGIICGLAALQLSEPKAPVHEYAARLAEPPVLRARFGSPLVFDLGFSFDIAKSAASLALLLYAFKRIWGLDIELRTHREQLWTHFYDAQARANEARERAAELGVQYRHHLDKEFEWRPGTTSIVDDRIRSTQDWEGSEARMSSDD